MTKETFLKNHPEPHNLSGRYLNTLAKRFIYTNRPTGDSKQKERRVINFFEYIVSSLSASFTLSRPSSLEVQRDVGESYTGNTIVTGVNVELLTPDKKPLDNRGSSLVLNSNSLFVYNN